MGRLLTLERTTVTDRGSGAALATRKRGYAARHLPPGDTEVGINKSEFFTSCCVLVCASHALLYSSISTPVCVVPLLCPRARRGLCGWPSPETSEGRGGRVCVLARAVDGRRSADSGLWI